MCDGHNAFGQILILTFGIILESFVQMHPEAFWSVTVSNSPQSSKCDLI